MKNLIKHTFWDISSLYKNFIHWNFSKIIIFTISILLWVISVIPLLIFYFIFSGFSFTDVTVLVTSIALTGQILTWLLANFVYLLAVLFFMIWFLYSYIYLINLNKSYIDWKNITYKSYLKFDYKTFCKYFRLALLLLVILVVPVILFVLITGIIIWLLGWVDAVTNIVLAWPTNIFSILSLIFFLLSVFLVIYLLYRFIFSFFLLTEKWNNEIWVIWLLKKSFSITKWFKKLFNLLLLLCLGLLSLTPFYLVWLLVSLEKADLDNYISYNNLEEWMKAQVLHWNSYYYNSLVIKYDNTELIDLKSRQENYDLYVSIYSIFKFIFMYWIFTMILTSFYTRIITKK